MAAMFRIVYRSLHTSIPRCNTIRNPPNPADYEKGVKVWRNLTFFVAFPAIGLCMVNAYLGEKEHIAHMKEHRPEFIPYEHLRIIKKRFPWGDGKHTLFFNPAINCTADGYEDEQEE